MASITATTATSRSRSWSAAGAASWSWHRSATTAGGPARATSPGTPRRSAPTSPCGTRRSRASLGSGVTACRATCAPRASGWATGSGRRAHPSPASRPRPRGPRWNEERYDERHRGAPCLRPPTECPGLAGPATMTLLRIGIVGARFAAELHAVNYRPLVGSKVELAAVCARTRSQAEDFVYAPPVAKLRRLLDASGGAILELRAEESHGGSHAAYAARWRTSGGGSLLRMGSHPVGVVLHLKHSEGLRRHGRPIRARTVLADVAQLTRLPTECLRWRTTPTGCEPI